MNLLDLPLPPNDSGAITIRGYLAALLIQLWKQGESFSGKRPFGNSGWEFMIYASLIKHGVVSGELDEDDFVEEVDDKKADTLVLEAIREMCGVGPEIQK